MRAKKKLSFRQKSMLKFLFSIISVLLIVVVYFEFTVKERIELAIISQVKSVSHKTVNDVVANYIKDNKELCDNLVMLSVDESENITFISENVYNVNRFKTDITKTAQNSVDNVMLEHGINVQLGNFTGLTILSDFGPYIHMDIDTTTYIVCEINSTFESVGINQSLHHISLIMYVDIYVGNPIRIESIKYTTTYEISQTVIVGAIPSAFGTISRY